MDVIVAIYINGIAVTVFVKTGFVDIDKRNLMIFGKFDVIIDVGEAFGDPAFSFFLRKFVGVLGEGVFIWGDGGDHDNDHFRTVLDESLHGGI